MLENKTLSEGLIDKFNKLPVDQEVEKAAWLYYEASKGRLQDMSDEELCASIVAECQAFLKAREDRTEEIFYEKFNEVAKVKYNLDVKWE